MVKKFILLSIFAIGILVLSPLVFEKENTACAVDSSCEGNFPNPITDICWDCMFPIRVLNVDINSEPSRAPMARAGINSAPCVCNRPSPVGPVPVPGIPIEIWEPARLIDVVRKPYCFPNMGGMDLDPGLYAPRGSNGKSPEKNGNSFWQAHYYIYPALSLFELFNNAACMTAGGFDVGYITEIDPMWNDDELSLILNPEAILFSLPPAQLAGLADCVKSTFGTAFDSLFWMSGCNGSFYPLNGNIAAEKNPVHGSLMLAERLLFKLRRMGILWASTLFNSEQWMCNPTPAPLLLKKSAYRMQMVNPVAVASGLGSCNPIGRSTLMYEGLKQNPSKDESFGYLVFKRRNCCAF